MIRFTGASTLLAVAILLASAPAAAQSSDDRVREVLEAVRPASPGPLQREVVPMLLLSYAREQLDRQGRERKLGLRWSPETDEWKAVEAATVERGEALAKRALAADAHPALSRCLQALPEEALASLAGATRSPEWTGYVASRAAARAAMIAMSDIHASLLARRDAMVERIVLDGIPEETPAVEAVVKASPCVQEIASALFATEAAVLKAQGALLASIQAQAVAAATGFQARIAREGPSRGHLVREVLDTFRPVHPTALQVQLPFLALAEARMRLDEAGKRLALGTAWSAASEEWATVEGIVNARGFELMRKAYGAEAGEELARCAESLSLPELEALVELGRDPDWPLYKKSRELQAALAALERPTHMELAGTREELAERMRHRLAHLPGATPDVRDQTRRIASGLRVIPCREAATMALEGGDRRALREMSAAIRELGPEIEQAAQRFQRRSQLAH